MRQLDDIDEDAYKTLWTSQSTGLCGTFVLAEYEGKLSVFETHSSEAVRKIPPSFYNDNVYTRIDHVNAFQLRNNPRVFEEIPKEYRERLQAQMVLAAL